MLSNFHAFPDPRPYCLGRSLRHRNDRWLRLVLWVAYPKTQCDLAEVESSRIIKQWSNVFRWNIPRNQIINQICLNYVMIHQPEMCSHLGIRNDPHNEHNRNHFQSRDLNKDGSFKYGWTIQFLPILGHMMSKHKATREIGWKPRFPHHIWDPSISGNKLNHPSGPSVNFSPQSVRHAHEALCLCKKNMATQYQAKTFRYVPVHCSPALTTKPFLQTFNQSMFDLSNFSASELSCPNRFAR